MKLLLLLDLRVDAVQVLTETDQLRLLPLRRRRHLRVQGVPQGTLELVQGRLSLGLYRPQLLLPPSSVRRRRSGRPRAHHRGDEFLLQLMEGGWPRRPGGSAPGKLCQRLGDDLQVEMWQEGVRLCEAVNTPPPRRASVPDFTPLLGTLEDLAQ